MRILTGTYKGRVLRTVRGFSVRPAMGRVRKTVFDILSNRNVLDGSRVLDLFAGSGSLGIECLSRGAAHVTFVENDPEAVRSIEENVGALGCEEQTDIVEMDAMLYALGRREPFDLLFADPPYRFAAIPTIPDLLFQNAIVAPDGYVMIEHTIDIRYKGTAQYMIDVEKRFGRTMVTFFRHQRNHRTGSV